MKTADRTEITDCSARPCAGHAATLAPDGKARTRDGRSYDAESSGRHRQTIFGLSPEVVGGGHMFVIVTSAQLTAIEDFESGVRDWPPSRGSRCR